MLLGKDTKNFEWLHSLPHWKKKPNDVAPIYKSSLICYLEQFRESTG